MGSMCTFLFKKFSVRIHFSVGEIYSVWVQGQFVPPGFEKKTEVEGC